jgi:hypothetical protein
MHLGWWEFGLGMGKRHRNFGGFKYVFFIL